MSTILPGFFRPLGFDPLALDPILAFSAQSSMIEAGGAAAENLDLVPTFQNLVSGGANASQTTASRQPRAHVPVGDGHLYLPGVGGNYASVPDADNLDGFGDFAMEFVGSSEDWHAGLALSLIGKWTSSGGYFVRLQANGTLFFLYNTSGGQNYHFSTAAHNLVDGAKGGIRVIRDGSSIKFYENLYQGSGWQQIGSPVSGSAATLVNGAQPLEVGTYNSGSSYPFNGPVFSAKIWNSASPETASPVLDVDFSGGDHKASTFACSTGQTVTINKSGNDPATIVRRKFLRFDGASSSLVGVFNETNTEGGYFFASFSVNGGGGTSSGRIFNMKSDDYPSAYNSNKSFIWSVRNASNNHLGYYYNHNWRGIHSGKFDESNGVILHEVKAIDGEQFSKVNNADTKSTSLGLTTLSSEDFYIAQNPSGTGTPAIDLEALYLFDENLTDAQATKVRDYLNENSNIY